MVYQTIPYFTSIYSNFVSYLSFFQASGRPKIFFTTLFSGYQINNTSTFTLQNPFILYFRLVTKHVKSGETTKRLLQMSHFLLHLSIEHLLCLVVLGNNDGEKFSLKFLFLLYVTLMVFCGKITSVC